MLPGGGGSSLVLVLALLLRELIKYSFPGPPPTPIEPAVHEYYYYDSEPVAEVVVSAGLGVRTGLDRVSSGLSIVLLLFCCCCCRQAVKKRKGRRLTIQPAP